MSKKTAKSSVEFEESLEEMMDKLHKDCDYLEPKLYDPNSKFSFSLISHVWSQLGNLTTF